MKTSYALKWIAFAFAAVVAVSGAKAADWKPTSDVEFVIPYGLGGGADLLARHHQDHDREKMVPVNVTAVNKPGGGASVGVAYVLTTKNANPNTLVLFNPQTQITPLTVKDARGWRDLTPVANLMLDDYLLFVGKDSPYKTAADLVKDAKTKPPKTISVGSAGTADDMSIAVFESAAGIKLNVVRFNSGGEALTALLGGHVNLASGNPLEFMGQMNAGQVRAIGVFRPTRFADLPNVPTMKEQGIDVVPFQMWRGVALPERPARRGGLLAGRDAEGRLVQGVHRLHQAELGNAARGRRPGLLQVPGDTGGAVQGHAQAPRGDLTLAASPTIRAVEAVPVRVEGAREFRISEGATRVHVSVVLRLLTDVDGLEGNAEVVSAPPGKPEEFLEEIVGAIERYVAPALIGMPVRERGRAVQAVAMALKGRVWTKAAVTNALYDLHAKAIGVPIADLLGGQLLQRVPVIGPVVGIMTPDAMATEAAAQSKAGFLAIKIKVGETVEADIDRVAAVRAAIGESISLRVDANDHYCPADAIRFTRAIERYRPEHIEQPVARHDMLGLAEVRRSVGVPIMTDDMVATPYDAMNVIRLGAADRVKVKVTKHGFDGARAICAMLSSAGLTPVLGHVFEMGLAAIAEAQFAACTPGLAMPCEIGSMAPMGTHADIVTNDLRSVPGYMTVPTGLGLGADVDWRRVRRGASESAA